MAHAYIPGLKVTERTIIHKDRRLPLLGEVIVKKGDKVTSNTVVARTFLPGNVTSVNVANKLGILPQDVKNSMVKKEGEQVKKGEIIATSKSFFGLFKSNCLSPIDGSIETVSDITGQVLMREPPIPVEVKAYIDGIVKEVFEKEGVLVETEGSLIQGIFGIGGETDGEIMMISQSPDDVLNETNITEKCAGKIIVGGSFVTHSALKKAVSVKARGVVVGGVSAQDLKNFLGYDLGVAITGSEEVGITLVVTEGFGKISMAQATFNLLKKMEGKKASINGATQIRAGVIRPEVVIPLLDEKVDIKEEKKEEVQSGMDIGSPIRVIREPYFGRIGKLVELPHQLQKLETESYARVLVIEFDNGERVTLPRANVEMIERK